jgi:hypothetical protein
MASAPASTRPRPVRQNSPRNENGAGAYHRLPPRNPARHFELPGTHILPGVPMSANSKQLLPGVDWRPHGPHKPVPPPTLDPPPPKHRRPQNTTAERDAEIVRGVLADRLDGALPAFAALWAELLDEVLGDPKVLAKLVRDEEFRGQRARSLGGRLVDELNVILFPELSDEDPEAMRAAQARELRRRADRADDEAEAAFWAACAAELLKQRGGGLVPAGGPERAGGARLAAYARKVEADREARLAQLARRVGGG